MIYDLFTFNFDIENPNATGEILLEREGLGADLPAELFPQILYWLKHSDNRRQIQRLHFRHYEELSDWEIITSATSSTWPIRSSRSEVVLSFHVTGRTGVVNTCSKGQRCISERSMRHEYFDGMQRKGARTSSLYASLLGGYLSLRTTAAYSARSSTSSTHVTSVVSLRSFISPALYHMTSRL